jgi:hypothetical protein
VTIARQKMTDSAKFCPVDDKCRANWAQERAMNGQVKPAVDRMGHVLGHRTSPQSPIRLSAESARSQLQASSEKVLLRARAEIETLLLGSAKAQDHS